MAEISELLNDLSKQFSIKINEIYEKKLEEHKMNISYNLDRGYTKYYGKLDLSKLTTNYICELNNFLKKNDNTRYIIHYCQCKSDDNKKTYGCIIDNYGAFVKLEITNYEYQHNFIESMIQSFKLSYEKTKYILPNILIDFIKSQNNFEITNLMNKIQLVSEDYYKRFTQNNTYNEINEHNKQYILQIEQLTEENNKIKLELQKQNETKLPPSSSYDDILFQQIKDLQNQLEICKKEKEEINKKFNDMKLLLGN